MQRASYSQCDRESEGNGFALDTGMKSLCLIGFQKEMEVGVNRKLRRGICIGGQLTPVDLGVAPVFQSLLHRHDIGQLVQTQP